MKTTRTLAFELNSADCDIEAFTADVTALAKQQRRLYADVLSEIIDIAQQLCIPHNAHVGAYYEATM